MCMYSLFKINWCIIFPLMIIFILHFSSSWRRFLTKRWRKLCYQIVWWALHVALWQASMAGLLTWRESWRHRLFVTPALWAIWQPRSTSRSIQIIALSLLWTRRFWKTRTTNLWKIWCICCLKPLSFPQDFLSTILKSILLASIEWSTLAWE